MTLRMLKLVLNNELCMSCMHIEVWTGHQVQPQMHCKQQKQMVPAEHRDHSSW
jgi:hypothetical protein